MLDTLFLAKHAKRLKHIRNTISTPLRNNRYLIVRRQMFYFKDITKTLNIRCIKILRFKKK